MSETEAPPSTLSSREGKDDPSNFSISSSTAISTYQPSPSCRYGSSDPHKRKESIEYSVSNPTTEGLSSYADPLLNGDTGNYHPAPHTHHPADVKPPSMNILPSSYSSREASSTPWNDPLVHRGERESTGMSNSDRKLENDGNDEISPDLVGDHSDAGLRSKKRERETDCETLLPIANISRIMKRKLPSSARIAKDAKELIQECATEFVQFVTSEASEHCSYEKRKTITGDDIIWSMRELGFDHYLEPLSEYLKKWKGLVNPIGSSPLDSVPGSANSSYSAMVPMGSPMNNLSASQMESQLSSPIQMHSMPTQSMSKAEIQVRDNH